MPEDFSPEPDDKALYIPSSSMEHFGTEAARVAWVTQQLAEQGVVFED